jgi:hypothetical protein
VFQVEDDPEYGFSDKFRTSRTSNQSRQLLMHKLANQLASKIAKKVTCMLACLSAAVVSNPSALLCVCVCVSVVVVVVCYQARTAGGNAVLGYQQHFDFEGDSGVVARAYGTVFKYDVAPL